MLFEEWGYRLTASVARGFSALTLRILHCRRSLGQLDVGRVLQMTSWLKLLRHLDNSATRRSTRLRIRTYSNNSNSRSSKVIDLGANRKRMQLPISHWSTYLLVFFTARCTLVQSAVLRSHVVCLTVRRHSSRIRFLRFFWKSKKRDFLRFFEVSCHNKKAVL